MSKKKKVDRSFTAVPCLTVFTKRTTKGGLPKNLYYILMFLLLVSIFLMKNIILSLLIGALYIVLVKINRKDDTTLEGALRMSKKRYISY
ncbi:MAG: hypothetical protein ACRC4T_20480 [Cetobacterium sp.]